MEAKADRYHTYYDNTRYEKPSMPRLKAPKKKTKKKGRKELVRDMLDYMADDFQDMMRAKKRMEEEALLGIQRFPRDMDAEIERLRKEERYNRKKKENNHTVCNGKPPRPSVNQTNKTERGIFNESWVADSCGVHVFLPILEWLYDFSGMVFCQTLLWCIYCVHVYTCLCNSVFFLRQ